MNKKLENYKIKIQSILDERISKFALKQTMKIDLVKRENLSDLFSMLSYSSNEKLEYLKAKLSDRLPIDDEINALNNELLNIISELRSYKDSCLQEMSLIERKNGTKVSITKSNGRIKIALKYAKRYSYLYSLVNSIDNLINFVTKATNEKPVFRYRIDDKDVASLSSENKVNYYTSLAALIMCEDIVNPDEVIINRPISVNKEDSSALLECYKGYRQACKTLEKEGKREKIKNSIKKAISNVKNFTCSLFGKNAESEVSMALRKSVLAATLSASVLASSLSFQSEGVIVKNNDVENTQTDETIVPVVDLLQFNKQGLKTPVADVFINEFKRNFCSSDVAFVAEDDNFLKESLVNAISNYVSLEDECDQEEKEEEEEISLVDTVPENAYEIVELVKVPDAMDSKEESEVKESSRVSQSVSGDDAITINLANVTTPQQSAMFAINENEVFTEFSGDTLVDVVNTVESIEVGNDSIIQGFHLTFNNTTYNFTAKELKYLYYVVKHEWNGTYQEAVNIISLIVNRIEDSRYSDDLIGVLSAKGQFVDWVEVEAEVSQYGDDFEMDERIYNAMVDVLQRGIRSCDYVEFKASWTGDYSTTGELKYQLVTDGNKFHNLALSLDRTTSDEETEDLITSEVVHQDFEKSKVLEKRL